jgi:hypothetical protein
MSMFPQPWPEVPELTTRVARAAFREGSPAIRARDEPGAWCHDADFAGCYQAAGAPGISLVRLAMVCVLQFCATMTDGRPLMRCGAAWTGSTAWAWS